MAEKRLNRLPLSWISEASWASSLSELGAGSADREPLRVEEARIVLPLTREEFAISADPGELQHHGCIGPAVLGFTEENLQRLFGRETARILSSSHFPSFSN